MFGKILGNRGTLYRLEGFYGQLKAVSGKVTKRSRTELPFRRKAVISICTNVNSLSIRMYKKLVTVADSRQEN